MSNTVWCLEGLLSVSDIQEIRNFNKRELLKKKRYIDFDSLYNFINNNNINKSRQKSISGPFDSYRDLFLSAYKKSKFCNYERFNAMNLSIEFTTSEEIYNETGLYGVEICGDDITFIGNTDIFVYYLYDLLNCDFKSNSKLCILDYGDRSLVEVNYIIDLARYFSYPRVILEFENGLNSDDVLSYLSR